MESDRSTKNSLVFAVKDTPPSQAVIRAVATAEDSNPLELSPLQEAVDVDSLNTILGGRRETEVTFPYEGFEVTVRANAEVILHPAD